MLVGVIKETFPGEHRVALVPAAVEVLKRSKIETVIEHAAGFAAGFTDAEYRDKGATLISRDEVISRADVLLVVRAPGANPDHGKSDFQKFRKGQIVIGFCDPLTAHEQTKASATSGITLFSIELMPRITRAQSMDALSSMATIAGYKAALLAASHLPRMMPMMITAAGTIAPAKVMVIGAGVMGLQAIASSRRMGAIVSAYDVRPAVKEQIESLGAKFIELDLKTENSEDKGGYAKAQDEAFYERQRELLGKVVAENDVLITTAAIPGRPSPLLVRTSAIERMRPGSVVLDLAAERGGNVECTQCNQTVVVNGVTVMGPANLAASVPYHASQMYAKNLQTFLLHLVNKEGSIDLDRDDEIVQGTLVTRAGEVVHPRVRELMQLPALVKAESGVAKRQA